MTMEESSSESTTESVTETVAEPTSSPTADQALQHAGDKTLHKIYPSKVDGWIAVLVMLGPLVTLGLAGYAMLHNEGQASMILLAVGAVTLLITALVTMPCRYTIAKDNLAIRCGVVFYRVPLKHIQSAEISGSWLSGPALSLKRVRVSTGTRSYLVSPLYREQFIQDLKAAIASQT
ncbi:MAG: hypothetical protein CBB71_02100 [Rhodopirellula sp. TMED11]|nr:MAG: hypothetical protein CBB71_02100 [Rhodopirellula sp. TMED11]